ncbi:MAG: hypothetical protein FWC41_00505 [Firmicutes bacterium]|nr:hypothetical protein [Bacillota bacterium]
MSKLIDITGEKFHKLTVIKRVENKNNKAYWLCKCDCDKDKEVIVSGNNLKTGSVKSCGCLISEMKLIKKEKINCTKIVGNKYNKLLILQILESGKNKDRYCKCLCECGNIKNILLSSILNNHTKSCGCLPKGGNIIHGKSYTRLYSIWRDMKGRCYNKNNVNYINYGYRNISISNEWLNSFELF